MIVGFWACPQVYETSGLKKRLFITLPDDSLVDAVAEAFAEQVKIAEDGGYLTARSMEAVAEEVRETYPFHPSFKNLVALFKENEGFRQTRGLMQFTARLLRSVWNREANDVFLIGTQHLDLNDPEVREEVQRVNPALLPRPWSMTSPTTAMPAPRRSTGICAAMPPPKLASWSSPPRCRGLSEPTLD